MDQGILEELRRAMRVITGDGSEDFPGLIIKLDRLANRVGHLEDQFKRDKDSRSWVMKLLVSNAVLMIVLITVAIVTHGKG